MQTRAPATAERLDAEACDVCDLVRDTISRGQEKSRRAELGCSSHMDLVHILSPLPPTGSHRLTGAHYAASQGHAPARRAEIGA